MTPMTRRLAYAAGLAVAALPTLAAAQAQRSNPSAKGDVSSAQASPASESYPQAAVGDGNTVNGYNQSRWVEDWTALRDPAKRTDILDQLKYIPIANDDVFLTLSGEARLRVNHVTNPNLRESRAQRQDIIRLTGGADLHLGEHVRLYGELAHGTLEGLELGAINANLRNKLVVQQSFVDVTGNAGGVDLGIRYGRQTFSDGSGLLVVPRDNNTIFFVYNGTRAWARGKRLRADVFDFRTTQFGTGGTGDDISERGRRFSGVTTGIVLPETLFGDSKLYVDPFVWRLRDREAQWGPSTAREVRNFYGVHVWGDVGRLDIDWTVNHQAGRFDNRKLRAWQVFAAQTYSLGDGPAAPRVGLHFDYATGGGAYDGGTLRTALAPFGNNIYYSYQLFATPTNLIAVAPSYTFTPLKKLRVTAEYQLSWRGTERDAVYRASGAAFDGTQDVSGRRIADTARLQVVYPISERLSFTGRYEHLMAKSALTNAGYGNSDFLAGWLSFRF